MRMIILILGLHLTAVGSVTALLAIVLRSMPDGIVAAVILADGLLLSFRFRKACAGYRSDPPRQDARSAN